MAAKKKTGKHLEKKVADAYRKMGAWKVEHDKEVGGHQIDVYVEMATRGNMLHRLAVEAKEWNEPVGIDVVSRFAEVVAGLRRRNHVDSGVIVSQCGFSRPGRNSAEGQPIELLEIADLEAMAQKAESEGVRAPTKPPISVPPTPYFAHPYPLQENFTGRAKEREMLTEWLTHGREPLFADVAIGGMGKSALTWAWLLRDVLGGELPGQPQDAPGVAERCRVDERDRPEGVLWWSFYEREASFDAFVNTALCYASEGTVVPGAIPSLHERSEALAYFLQRRRILLVLDGLERELQAYASLNAAYQGDEVRQDDREAYRTCTDPHAGRFLQWLAAGPLAGRVLITSRLFPRELDGMPACQRVDLNALDPEDAATFFHAQGVKGTRAEIQAACEPYGYHALALRLLAGTIVSDPAKRGDVSVASEYDVTDDLKPREHNILDLAYNALAADRRELLSRLAAFRSPMDYEAIEAIARGADEGGHVLRRLMRALRGKAPPRTVANVRVAIRDLVTRGLLLLDREHDRYDLHPIIRRYAYDRLRDKQGVHRTLRDYFDAVPAPEKVESVDDLAPVIELYHHTVGAGRYDEAARLLRDRLVPDPLHYRFGAYQTMIELKLALFPDGETRPPRLSHESAQAWTLNALATSYSFSGQPRRALPLFEASNGMSEKRGDKRGVAIGLANLARERIGLGELDGAERNLRRSIELCREIEDELRKGVGHSELGRLLAHRGAFDEAAHELDVAIEVFTELTEPQPQGVGWAYRALRDVLMREPRSCLQDARRARELGDEFAGTRFPVQRDYVRAEWLLGWALVDLGAAEADRRDQYLTEAEGHLTEALTRCRRINMVDHEPDILLAWAKWHRLRGERDVALERAKEALGIADRCEYRLCQADIHNFLARAALDAGDRAGAERHARIAHERAWCDGPPYCYKPALDEADGLLQELGLEAPTGP